MDASIMKQEVTKALQSFLKDVTSNKPVDISSIFSEISAEPSPQAATVTVTKSEEVESPIFTYLPVIKSAGRIRIDSNDLREFIVHDTDINLFTASIINEDHDKEDLKERRKAATVKDVREWFPHLGTLKSFDSVDINNGCSDISFEEFTSFVNEIEKHYLKYMEGSEKAFASGKISFSDLSTYMVVQKGQFIVRENDALVAGEMVRAIVKPSMMGPYLELTMNVYFNNIEGLSQNAVQAYIMSYEGEKTLDELGLWALTKGSKEYNELVRRGERYLELTSVPKYVQVEGVQAYRTYWSTRKYDATGRFVIDFSGMKRAHSGYSRFYAYEDNNSGYGRVKPPRAKIDPKTVSDDIKATCSPFLYGFSLKSKQWGEINIEQVSSIKFRTDAYDKLVLDPETKELIFAQVEDRNPTKEADLIDGKGGGVIFLLAGTPGLGKTLTAEAVAERLQRPLYTVSVGELGTNVSDLESSLRSILETATEWNAILLIDEADIFLEARTDMDIERNAMVAVFLRLLEYYQGILFLTTNRAANLDEAFFSRISLAIHFPDLKIGQRKQIWGNLLHAAGIPQSSVDTHVLAQNHLNGRQIKHVIKTAGAIARYKGRNINSEDFELIISKQNQFRDYVNSLKNDGEIIDAEFKVVEDPQNMVGNTPPKLSFWGKLKAVFG